MVAHSYFLQVTHLISREKEAVAFLQMTHSLSIAITLTKSRGMPNQKERINIPTQ